MQFKDVKEPICTQDTYYDAMNGYINPSKLLEDEDDINNVKAALNTVRDFLEEAEDNGVLEVC